MKRTEIAAKLNYLASNVLLKDIQKLCIIAAREIRTFDKLQENSMKKTENLQSKNRELVKKIESLESEAQDEEV